MTFLRTEQRDQARDTLAKLTESAKLSDAELAFVLAQGLELLGDLKGAEENYRKAERLAPDNVAVQRRLVAFLLRNDPSQAKLSASHLLEMSPESGEARRSLATVLAASGKDSDWREAMQLLGRRDLGPDERRSISG